MFKDNPAYKLELEAHGYRLYTPVNIAEGYSTQRYVEATNQQIYAANGMTAERMAQLDEYEEQRLNDEKNIKTLRTDLAAVVQARKYMRTNPVDEQVGIKMGAILSFMEYEEDGKTISEDPDRPAQHWLGKKIRLAHHHPEFYTFFLSWGAENSPIYRDFLNRSTLDTEYFLRREETIRSLLPSGLLATW